MKGVHISKPRLYTHITDLHIHKYPLNYPPSFTCYIIHVAAQSSGTCFRHSCALHPRGQFREGLKPSSSYKPSTHDPLITLVLRLYLLTYLLTYTFDCQVSWYLCCCRHPGSWEPRRWLLVTEIPWSGSYDTCDICCCFHTPDNGMIIKPIQSSSSRAALRLVWARVPAPFRPITS